MRARWPFFLWCLLLLAFYSSGSYKILISCYFETRINNSLQESAINSVTTSVSSINSILYLYFYLQFVLLMVLRLGILVCVETFLIYSSQIFQIVATKYVIETYQNIPEQMVNDFLITFFSIKNCFHIWDRAFKNEPSKICGRKPLKKLEGYGLLKQEDYLPQVLLGPFLNTFSHI